ncbi:hypothetical protein SESBI_23034 [Sesbania bispinosa]|nr:hypothetical protein SESBI_23034 [Sesbania bispinosa]
MGPRGCVAYTPSIVLRQLKCTQIKPVEEPLGGASFLYGTNDVGLLIEEIKSAWGDIKWKGEKELGKTRVIASPEYKEWRKARGVPPPTPMEAVHNEASPATLSQIITTMTSEAERMKAQMTFMEEKADVADLRITILEAQCRKKDKEIKDLQNDCEKACADADQARNAKRPRKGKEGKEDSTSAEMKKMQDHLELMEKEKLEHAKKLKVEQDQLQSQVEKLKRVEEEKNGWELLAGYQQNRKKEWIRTCEDMADCVQTQATNLANHVHDAVEEVNSNPEIKMPWKTFRLMKFCQDVVRSLVRQ